MEFRHIKCLFFFRMIDLARKLDKADREALSRCAHHLSRLEQYGYAAEVFAKMGDMKSLIAMRVEAKHWDDVRLILPTLLLCNFWGVFGFFLQKN